MTTTSWDWSCETRTLTPDDLEDVEGSLENPPKPNEARRLENISQRLAEERRGFKTLGLTAEEMLTHKAFAQVWGEDIKDGDSVVRGDKFTFEGKLYNVRQNHVINIANVPSVNTAALYEVVTPEFTEDGEEFGTLDRPISYNGNMALESGKYYEQGGVLYLCTRDTVNPVYHDLTALVGQYVEAV